MITGESRPVSKELGDRVVAGTVSTDSAVRVRVDALGDDTALAGIQRLVAEAQQSHSRAQALADRARSEEHTSELQSLMRISYAVFCLKKKKKTTQHDNILTTTNIANA